MVLSFEELGLEPNFVQAVEQLGYQQPTPIQLAAIPVLLEGRSVLGQAQTGTGKTAAFALPMLQSIEPGAGHIQALVLAPTRELAIQVAEATLSLAQMTPVRVLAVYGGQSYEIQKRHLKRGVDVVVGTPGRLLDLMRQKVLDLSHVRYLVLDEADEMLEMGFIEDVETILAQMPADRQTALFSATLPDAIRKLADRYLTNPHQISINPSRRTVEETDQSAIFLREEDKIPALVRLLEAESVKSALIFARTKIRAQELADALISRGYPAESLHGDLSQSRREYVLNRFRQNRVTLLVATDVAARGLDIENVSHVINYDAPQDGEDYVHRIGRTGRAGRKGVAITFFSSRERIRRTNIERYTRQVMVDRAVPSLEEIIARRDDALVGQVEDQMIQADHQRERELIARMVHTGYDPLEIASAALKLARAGETSLPVDMVEAIRFESKRRRSDGPPPGAVVERLPRKDVFEAPAWNNRKSESSGKKVRGTVEAPVLDSDPRRSKNRPVGASFGDRKKKGQSEPGMVTLWMNMGEQHGIRPKDVVGAIAGEVGIPGKAIGEIDIRGDHTLVDVSEKHVRKVLQQSWGNYRLRGKPVLLKMNS